MCVCVCVCIHYRPELLRVHTLANSISPSENSLRYKKDESSPVLKADPPRLRSQIRSRHRHRLPLPMNLHVFTNSASLVGVECIVSVDKPVDDECSNMGIRIELRCIG